MDYLCDSRRSVGSTGPGHPRACQEGPHPLRHPRLYRIRLRRHAAAPYAWSMCVLSGRTTGRPGYIGPTGAAGTTTHFHLGNYRSTVPIQRILRAGRSCWRMGIATASAGAAGLVGDCCGPDGAAGGRGRSETVESGLHDNAISRERADQLLQPPRHWQGIYYWCGTVAFDVRSPV